ncbi:MAG: PilZ domain-containing protein [Candidatus Omnitrophica bacterium]|nr:PilZ domain-containing protein [Candidatus Omnitrophota bacterium]
METQRLAQLLSKEKRRSDRLGLPIKISYCLPKENKWEGPLYVINASGGGIRFITNKNIEENTELDIKIIIPKESRNPISLKGTVVWCRKKYPNSKDYYVGVKFHKMQDDDRRRYVVYLCENILLHNLKNQN